MGDTSIEWTDKTWNPTRGCSRISPGCEHCYAELMAARFSGHGLWGEGYAYRDAKGPHWTRKVDLVPDNLDLPLSWRKPSLVFVNSTSDLFHEKLSDEDVEAAFGVMAACPHTFQVLTKRAERMSSWFAKRGGVETREECVAGEAERRAGVIWDGRGSEQHLYPPPWPTHRLADRRAWPGWPLPNVWLGVSVEDCKHGLPRIDHLRRTPAAVRFLSIEPLLEDLGEIDLTGIQWVIVGGESGPGARGFDLAWARSIVAQCKAACVPVFVKQLGDCGGDGLVRIRGTYGPKGKAMETWPDDLRVREWPEARR